MTKALVTGGTGFIGSHVVRRLLKEGMAVRCLARPGSSRRNLEGLSVEISEGDLQDRPSLDRAAAGCDHLFHVAADYRIWARHPEELIRSNVEGTRNMLEAAAQAGIKRVVFTSSVAAVGRPVLSDGTLGVGREELDPPPGQQVGIYKQTKFQADLVAREYAKKGLPVVIVCPAAPIGSHDIKPTPTGRLILDFLNRKMPAYIETGMNFIDVEDVAYGHSQAAGKGRTGERYILGNVNLSLKEFLQKLADVSGLPAPKIRIPYAVAWLAGAISTGIANITGREPRIPLDGVRMGHAPMYYDPSKAVKELGLPQKPIEIAIQKAVDWFRKNGYVR
jgi:dihydroflavonol-4-reductase